MSPAQCLAAVAALLTIGGVWLIVMGARRQSVEVRPARPTRLNGRRALHWTSALILGTTVGVLTQWIALAVAATAAAITLPLAFGSARAQSLRIARVEAVEEFARRLADVLAIGVGLEQAILTAARSSPRPIQAEVDGLSARISARMPSETALRLFAEEMDDPTSDLVVAALILASRRRGPGISAALSAVAESVAEDVAARRRIEADRAKPRTTAQAVTVITVILVLFGAVNRTYSQPYGTAVGQVVLAGTLAGFAACLWWMHSMTRSTRGARILGMPADQPARPEPT